MTVNGMRKVCWMPDDDDVDDQVYELWRLAHMPSMIHQMDQ